MIYYAYNKIKDINIPEHLIKEYADLIIKIDSIIEDLEIKKNIYNFRS